MEKVKKSNEEWKKILTPEQYHIAREKGTERPYTGEYYDNHDKGVYKCVACGNELFTSENKFDSGCGWPSFDQPLAKDKVQTQEDDSHFMRRTEVMCSVCDAHLGHVFPDGPPTTGLRYCINSASLKLHKK